MNYNFVDTHTDTLFKILFESKDNFFSKNSDLHIDYNKILESNIMAQTFGIFTDDWDNIEKTRDAFIKEVSLFFNILEKSNGNLIHAKSVNDIFLSKKEGKVPCILSIEGCGFIDNIMYMDLIKQIGIKILSLTWSKENSCGFGNDCDQSQELKPLGVDIINFCTKNKILIDISHLNYKGFWQTCELTDKIPIIASHSNIYRLCPTPRNLKDEQIKAIKNKNGVIGITLYTDILSKNKSSIDTIISHIDYICERYGEDYVGLGTDFDGIEELPEGIENITSINKIFNKLENMGYSNETINKISSGNFLRVFNEVWGK